tara:strand:- start:179 stop:1315 length:1137 start_codon:yes stop_codon:yes gene_type:complete
MTKAAELAKMGEVLTNSQIGGRRNIVINGAMQVAQRGTSSTTDSDFAVDRFKHSFSGTDEAPTFAQVDVASGTTPYTSGFRKSLKVTNGNQTSGAGAGDLIQLSTDLEGQDIAKSGWNYNSTSSFIVLSFYVKSSVAQNFFGYLNITISPTRFFPFETGTLTADTWTKVTKIIPGSSSPTLAFANDTAKGLQIAWFPFFGTNFTASGVSLDTWTVANNSERIPDMTSTWYTTNDATFEITGVQLEVGSQATPFEHRSFGEELALCQRYYQRYSGSTSFARYAIASNLSTTHAEAYLNTVVSMRASPSLETTGTASNYSLYDSDDVIALTSIAIEGGGNYSNNIIVIDAVVSSGLTDGGSSQLLNSNSTTGFLALSSEL